MFTTGGHLGRGALDWSVDEARSNPKLSRRRFLGGAALGAAGLLGGGTVLSAYHFEISRHRVAVERLRAPLRVVQLTDLHYGPYVREGSLGAWVAATQAESPDLVVITGDFVDMALEDDLAPLERALAGLRAPLGVWGVWGNHDHGRFPDLGVLERSLARAGVTILVNEGVRLRDDFYLAGVDDANKRIRRVLRERPEDAASLMLLHNPLVFFDYELEAEASLTLCGHTHGGQVRVPVLGPLLIPEEYGARFIDGWFELPEPTYISRGLGVGVLPVRVNCPAELAVFDLIPA